jgi:2-dehydropantoate 2-reductase
MKITVVGSGGVGGFFGGMLARAGHEVLFVARGEHLDAIRTNGLKLVRDNEEFIVYPDATDNPGLNGVSDLVLFTVKTYDSKLAINIVKDTIGENTRILTLQNGVDSYRELERVFGSERVLTGAAYVESKIDSPGLIKQTGDIVRIVFGKTDGKLTREAKVIEEGLNKAGIRAELSANVLETLWTKFIFIASVAGVSAACRTRLGVLMKMGGYKELLIGTMKEIEGVARQKGICLDSDVVERTMVYVTEAVKDIMASMHLDLEKGRKLELEALNGTVVRMGREMGIATPLNETIYLVLKPFEWGAPV